MRNYLTLVIGVMIISSSAFASRARLEALGENKNGSFFIDDGRNIWYNPAQINNYKKKMYLELGSELGTSPTVANEAKVADSTAVSKPEGGFTNTFGDFTYGVFLGHESDRTLNAINGAVSTNGVSGINAAAGENFIAPDRFIDVFFGGDAGVKWGLNVFYGGNENRTTGVTNISPGVEQTASELGFRLGVIAGQLQGFATIGAMEKSTGSGGATGTNGLATDQLKGKFSMDLGATYSLSDNHTVFAKFTTNGAEYDPAGTKAADSSNMTVEGGIGCKKDVTKNTNVFSRLELMYGSSKNNTVSTGATTTAKMWDIPLSLGVETAALSWLTVRGSVGESLLGQNINSDNTRSTFLNSTTVGAGVGLTFGDVQIDGLVATGGGSNSVTAGNITSSNIATAGATGTNANWGFGNNMMTRLGMTYNF